VEPALPRLATLGRPSVTPAALAHSSPQRPAFARLGELVAAQAVEDEARRSGLRGGVARSVAELDAVIGWLQRDRLPGVFAFWTRRSSVCLARAETRRLRTPGSTNGSHSKSARASPRPPHVVRVAFAATRPEAELFRGVARRLQLARTLTSGATGPGLRPVKPTPAPSAGTRNRDETARKVEPRLSLCRPIMPELAE
jgi:hypothetical protein